MSIKLSIKDLKDLLKIQTKQIKKRKRRNKRIIKNNDNNNYNKSSSDHMKSIGFTNTSNEATELIRLQRQTLEDKLKADKENKIKADEKEKADNEIDDDFIYYPKLRYPSLNNGGSSTLRATQNDNKNLYSSHQGPIEDIDEDEDLPQAIRTGFTSDEVIMPSHKTKENDFRNVKFNTFYIADDSDHLSAWDEPPDKSWKGYFHVKGPKEQKLVEVRMT